MNAFRASLTLTLWALVPVLPAQTWVTSPTWIGGGRGDSSNAIQSFWNATESRFQIADQSLRGYPGLIERMQFRREESATVDGLPRSTDLTVRMAHCAIDQISTVFDGNNATPWVTVFQGSVSLPLTTAATDGWSRISLPQFQTPFPYDGQNDLLIEIRCRNTSETSAYPLDATDGREAGVGLSSYYAAEASCTHDGDTFRIFTKTPKTHANRVAHVETYATGSAPSSPSALLWGFRAPAANVLGTCGDLCLNPILLGSPAASDPQGRIGTSASPLLFRFPANRNGEIAIQFVSVAPTGAAFDLLLSDPTELRIQRQDSGNPVRMVWSHSSADAPLGKVTDQQVPMFRLWIR